jgi:HEAT repeat protein
LIEAFEMKSQHNHLSLLLLAFIVMSGNALAQTESGNADEELKIAALEALISAPPERALPIVQRVMAGDHGDEVKERALFILSQIDAPQAQTILLDTARTASGELQHEAIRMIGIGGDAATLANLREIYEDGDKEVKESVLEAFLIADDAASILEIASATDDREAFEEAVETLGAMGALDELRTLRERVGNSEELVEAYAIAGDYETLREMALDNSDPEIQEEAIEGLGIVGGPEVNQTLMEIYRNAQNDRAREASLEGMLISGHSEGVLQLFRESQDAAEKRELLETLVIMDSEAAMQVIDETLGGN